MLAISSKVPSEVLLGQFIAALRAKRHADVLELGTLRSQADRPTHHREWCASDVRFLMSDLAPGLDVDVVANIHALTRRFARNRFDFVIACSVLEHVQRPWIAARQIAAVLRPGGQVFVQTHQTYPLHGFPCDYWRFTQEALATLFEDAGLRAIATCYQFPAHIVADDAAAASGGIAFLNVCIVAQKPTLSERWRPLLAGIARPLIPAPLRRRLINLIRRRPPRYL